MRLRYQTQRDNWRLHPRRSERLCECWATSGALAATQAQPLVFATNFPRKVLKVDFALGGAELKPWLFRRANRAWERNASLASNPSSRSPRYSSIWKPSRQPNESARRACTISSFALPSTPSEKVRLTAIRASRSDVALAVPQGF